ncbi:MAG TPA: transglutaminase-like domain-containing protein [Anaerolineae bacterium]|nr:transglutaminase-like domain-containing protein [Anaerolineae bacterium]
MTTDFAAAISSLDHQIDLARAALLFARDAYPGLDPDRYLHQLDVWADAIRPALASRRSEPPFEVLNDLLFDQLGFYGNDTDYYDPRNSYLNEVIERRTGLPIALSVIYLEIGWRVGLPVSGVGLPGHFIVRCDLDKRTWFIDPFHRGDVLSEADCARLVRQSVGDLPFSPALLQPVTRRQIITRMLTNLQVIYVQHEQFAQARTVIERLLELDPAAPEHVRDLGLIHFRLGAFRRAIDLLVAYAALKPKAGDLNSIQQVIQVAHGELARWN